MKSSNEPSLPVSSKRTRRQFLANGLRLVAGSAVARLDPARFAHAAGGSEEIRIALVGCGGRGSGAAGQALSTYPLGPIKLVAMADIHPDRLESSLANLTKIHGPRVDVPPERQFIGFDAYKKALELGDVVLLTAPSAFRALHFSAAVAAGKHCFLEKSLGVDMVSLRQVLATNVAARQRGLSAVVGLNRRFQEGYQQTIARVHDGAIGRIERMEAYWRGTTPWLKTRADLNKIYGREVTELEFQLRNWMHFSWLSGTLAVERVIHNIDVCLWAKREMPVKVRAVGEKRKNTDRDYGDCFDFVHADYDFADGSTMAAETYQLSDMPHEISETLFGDKGTADLGRAKIVGRDGSQLPALASTGDPYQREQDELFKAIRNGVPLNNVEACVNSNIACVMARIAAATGREVTWKEAMSSNDSLFVTPTSWNSPAPAQLDKFGDYAFPPRVRGS